MNLKIWHLITFATIIIIVVVLLLPSQRDEGILLARSGKTENAEKILAPVIKKNPLDLMVVRELAESYVAQDKSEKAIEVYEKYLEKGGQNKAVKKDLTLLYIGNYKYDQAIKMLAQNKDKNLDELVDLSVKMGNLKKAIEYSKDKLALVDDNKEERIKVLKNIEKYEAWQLNAKGEGQAIEELARAENNVDGDYKALEYYIWKNNKKKMRLYADKVSAYNDLPIDKLRVLRTTWISLKDAKNAIKVAREITTLKGVEYSDWADYMTILGWTGNKTEQQRVVEYLITKYPDNADLYWSELEFLPNDGKNLKRAAIDEKLYRLVGNPGLLIEAAQIYTNNKQFDKVDRLYKGIILDKDFIRSAESNTAQEILLAEAYWGVGNKKKALESYNNVYKKMLSNNISAEDINTIWATIALAKKKNSKLEEANLYMSLHRLTGDLQLLKDARDLYFAVKHDKKALAIDKKLFADNELTPFEKLEMLKAYKRTSSPEEAEVVAKSLYKEVLDSKNELKDEESYWSALDAAEELDDKPVRAEILQKFYKVSGDPELLREAATILSAEGKNRAVVAIYEELEQKNQLTPFGTSELLRLYQKLKMSKKLESLTSKVYDLAMKNQVPDKEQDQYYSLLDILPELGRGSDRLKLIKKYAASGDIESIILLAENYQDDKQLAQAKLELKKIIADKNATKEDKEQAELQLANIVSIEYYGSDEPEKQLQILNQGAGTIELVIKNLQRDMSSLAGVELKDREQTIDDFRELQIRHAFLKNDYILVDQLITELYNPSSANYLNIAGLYYDVGEENSAKRYFKKVTDTKGFTKEQYAQLGLLYSDFDENDKALLAYMKADRMANGLDKDIRLGLAAVYGKLGKDDKQYEIVDFYTTFSNAKTADWVASADARVEHNDPMGEYRILKKAVEKLPDSAVLLARIASRLTGLSQNEEAVVYAKKMEGLKVEKNENDLITIGYGLLDVGQVREAGRMFAVASNINNKNEEAKLALARYFVACFQYPQAHRIYKSYLSEHKDDGRVWYEYALLKHTAGFVGSREAFVKSKTLLQNGKQRGEDLSIISSIDFYLNRRDHALARAKYASQLDQKNEVYALDLAELYNSYNYPEYGKLVAQNIKENEFNSSRRNGLIAEAELMSRRFIEGISDLKKVLAVRSDDSASQLAKGYSEVEIGEWIEGAADLAAGEKLSDAEYEKQNLKYQHRATRRMFENVKLPDLEE